MWQPAVALALVVVAVVFGFKLLLLQRSRHAKITLPIIVSCFA